MSTLKMFTLVLIADCNTGFGHMMNNGRHVLFTLLYQMNDSSRKGGHMSGTVHLRTCNVGGHEKGSAVIDILWKMIHATFVD